MNQKRYQLLSVWFVLLPFILSCLAIQDLSTPEEEPTPTYDFEFDPFSEGNTAEPLPEISFDVASIPTYSGLIGGGGLVVCPYGSRYQANNAITFMNPDGSGNPTIVWRQDTESYYRYPIFSPDKKQLIFTKSVYGTELFELFIMRTGDSIPLQITHELDNGAYTVEPTLGEGSSQWSPNGKYIAYTALGGPRGDKTVVITPDGQNRWEYYVKSTNDEPNYGEYVKSTKFAGWSPDSTQILIYDYIDYDSSRESSNIYVVDITTQNVRELTDKQDSQRDKLALWSPDGSKILFVRDSHNDPTVNGIYTINPDGSNEQRILGPDGVDKVNGHPSWLPDSSRIIFISDSKDNNHLYVMNSDGSNLIRISQGNGGYKGFVLSPDGKYYAGGATADGTTIYSIDGSKSWIVPDCWGIEDWLP